MDALFSNALGHGLIWFWAWMLCSQNGVDHLVLGIGCRGNTANNDGFGTASKGNAVNTEGSLHLQDS